MRTRMLLVLFTAVLYVLEINCNQISDVPNPDLKTETDSCPLEGCPSEPTGTNEPIITEPPLTAEYEEDMKKINELAEVPNPAWWDLLSKAKTELTRVTRTLHDTLSSITSKFADIVRHILNEELYDIIARTLTKVMFKPGEALNDVVEAILSVCFLVFCFICSYVFFKLFPFLFVIAFLSTMILLHHFLGPMLIFKGIYFGAKHIFGVSWIIAKHPKLTSALIVTLVVIFIVYSIWLMFKSWSDQRNERERKKKLYCQVDDLSKAVEVLKQQQQKMLNILEGEKPDTKNANQQILEKSREKNGEKAETDAQDTGKV